MFTTESYFKPQGQKGNKDMWEIRTIREEIQEIVKKLEERKAIRQDLSGFILKKCRQKMAESIYDIIVFF